MCGSIQKFTQTCANTGMYQSACLHMYLLPNTQGERARLPREANIGIAPFDRPHLAGHSDRDACMHLGTQVYICTDTASPHGALLMMKDTLRCAVILPLQLSFHTWEFQISVRIWLHLVKFRPQFRRNWSGIWSRLANIVRTWPKFARLRLRFGRSRPDLHQMWQSLGPHIAKHGR